MMVCSDAGVLVVSDAYAPAKLHASKSFDGTETAGAAAENKEGTRGHRLPHINLLGFHMPPPVHTNFVLPYRIHRHPNGDIVY